MTRTGRAGNKGPGQGDTVLVAESQQTRAGDVPLGLRTPPVHLGPSRRCLFSRHAQKCGEAWASDANGCQGPMRLPAYIVKVKR